MKEFDKNFKIKKPLTGDKIDTYFHWSNWCSNNNLQIEQNEQEYYSRECAQVISENQIKINELQKYLNETDWYVARKSETGKEIPSEILKAREEARKEISRLRGDTDL